MSHSDAPTPKRNELPLNNAQPQLTRRTVLQASGGAAVMAAIQPLAQAAPGETAAALPRVATISVNVNQSRRTLTLDSRQSLLDALRETLNLTGTKKGCNAGACGSCTIILNGQRINSCLTLAVMHDGAEITTIEGLANGDQLHPLQEAFIKHDAMQCGYCTPGQILSAVCCVQEGHATTQEDIKFWMSGNICRCGAYPGIVSAIAEVAKET